MAQSWTWTEERQKRQAGPRQLPQRLGWLARRAAVSGLLVAVVSGGAWAGAAPTPKDVPPTHWAYQAVKTLLDRGYLAVDASGQFKGDQPVDRYTLAEVVARLLADVESGRARLAEKDIELLRQLATEYREELVRYYQQVKATDEVAKGAQRQVDVLDDKINNILSALDRLQRQAADLSRATQELQATLAAQGKQVGTLASKEDLAAADQRAAKEREVLKGQLDSLAAQVAQASRDLATVRVALNQRVQELMQADSRLGEQLGALSQRTGNVEKGLDELRTSLGQLERVTAGDAQAQQAAVAVLQGKVEENGRQVAELARRTQELASNLQGLGTEVQALRERQLADVSSQVRTVAGKAAALEQQVGQVQAALAQLQRVTDGQAQAQQAATGVLQGKVEENARQLADLTRRTQELASGLQAVTAQLESLRQQDLAAVAARVDALAGRTGNLEQQFAEVRARLASETDALRQQQAKDREAWTAALGAANQAQTARSDQLEGRLSRLEASLKQQGDSLRAELAAAQQGLAGQDQRLQQQLEQQAGQLASVQQRLQGLEGTTGQLADRVAKVEGQVGQLQAGLQQQGEALRGELAPVAETVAAHGQRLDQQEQQLAGVSQRLDQEAARTTQLESRTGQVEARAGRLEERATQLEARAGEAAQQLADQAEQLRRLMETQQAAMQQMQAQLAQLQQALASAREEVARLRAENQKLNEEVHNLQAAYEAVRGDLGLTEDQMAAISKRLRDEMASQLNLTLVREEQLRRQLQDLRNEFDAYKQENEEKVRGLRSSNSLAITTGVLGILGSLLFK